MPDESVLPNPGQPTQRPDDTPMKLTPQVTVPDVTVPEPKTVVVEADSGRVLPDMTYNTVDRIAMTPDSVESKGSEQLAKLESSEPAVVFHWFGWKLRQLIRARKGPRKVAMPKGEAVQGSHTWQQPLQFVAAGNPREFPLVNWDPG